MQAAGWRCLQCSYLGPPVYGQKTSAGGWIVFGLLLLFCFPLCFLGLGMKEPFTKCPQCGAKVG